MSDDLKFFCNSRNTPESHELARRVVAAHATNEKSLDLAGFDESFLNGLPTEVTRHIGELGSVFFPALLGSLPPWLSIHCPEFVDVLMYLGDRIEIHHPRLKELKLQAGPMLRDVHVPQGTLLTSHPQSEIRNTILGKKGVLQSTNGLQPVSAHFHDFNRKEVWRAAYPGRVFVESHPRCLPGAYENFNGTANGRGGTPMVCRHIAEKFSEVFLAWHQCQRDRPLGKVIHEFFGSAAAMQRNLDRYMDERCQLRRTGGAPLHLTPREGVVDYLVAQMHGLDDGEARSYMLGLEAGANSAQAGHATTLAIWCERGPDARKIFHFLSHDPNLSGMAIRLSLSAPEDLRDFELFRDLHMPYEQYDYPAMTLHRKDGYYEKSPDQMKDGPLEPERNATFGIEPVPEVAQPSICCYLFDYNQSLEPVQNWLLGKTGREQKLVLQNWPRAVFNGSVETIEEFFDLLVSQYDRLRLGKDDIADILLGSSASYWMSLGLASSAIQVPAAFKADGVRALGRALEKMMSRHLISAPQAAEILLGKSWRQRTYAGVGLDQGSHLCAVAVREAMERWCSKKYMAPADIPSYLHDASWDRIERVRARAERDQ